jgi:pyruvate formate lyase activating enzyme
MKGGRPLAGIKTASYYRQLEENQIECLLCPHQCVIRQDKQGSCRARYNLAGVLIAGNFGQVGAMHLDPVEKKPLYHFYPGKQILSIGTFGCNFDCGFCQNWQLARGSGSRGFMQPEELIKLIEEQFPHLQDNVGIAFTYNEPLIWYEYVLETSRLAQQAGLKVALITNGFLNQEPFQQLLPYVDALNIDLKSFREDYYRRYCGGRLEPVLENIKTAIQVCHVEITTLVVTGLNDSKEELEELTRWLGKLNDNIPLHLSRYFPHYKLDRQPTPAEKMLEAAEIARKYLRFVYLGNLPQLGKANNTYCHQCGRELIVRTGYQTTISGLVPDRESHGVGEDMARTAGQGSKASICEKCGVKIPVVMG